MDTLNMSSYNYTVAYMLWGVVFSSIGFAYFLYGKKEKNYIILGSGIALMIYPYFLQNTYLLVLLGVLITAVPYYWQD